jgi:prophage antirepressor-like protein
MEVVKAFNSNKLHTEIVIKGTYDDPLFRASDIGTILEMVNIRATIQHYNDTEKVVKEFDTPGGTQQVTFLTEKGLYKVLFKSRKPIAEKFQDWACEVIKEIRATGVYRLKKEFDAKLSQEKALEKEQFLLREYATIGSIVYIIKVKSYENGEYVIKIGESRRGVQLRYNEHKTKYEECLLLDCFLVKKSKDFENYLHSHENIKYTKVTTLANHENERELFLIGKGLAYSTLLHIITSNINQFNEYTENDFEKLHLENEMLKQLIMGNTCPMQQNQNTSDSICMQENITNQKMILEKIQNLEKTNKEIMEKLHSMQTKTTTNFNQPLVTLGPRLQQINPDTFIIHKVYESVAECIKAHNYKLKRPSIAKAISENTVYNGFRWMFVDRNKDPNILENIEQTKITTIKQPGYIAKLNKDKTEILNVYLDRKTAAKYNEYLSSAALDGPVKNTTLTNGHYYVLYDKCSNGLKNSFIQKNNGEPLLYKDGVGQYDNENNLIKEYVCKYDCIKQLQISDKTLTKALTNNIMYKNNYFKHLGSKVKCF